MRKTLLFCHSTITILEFKFICRKCPATAVLSEEGVVRPTSPHNGHPSPIPHLKAKNAEYQGRRFMSCSHGQS